jgi:hypothetical protein
MSLKTHVESNPFAYLIGVAVSVGGLVFWVVSYFCSEKLVVTELTHKEKIAESENRLASINRKLAGGDYMDVAHFVVHPGDRNRLPAQSKFYSDDSFYAPAPQGWTYKKTTDKEFFASIFGEEGQKQVNEYTGLGPIHVWTRGALVPVGNHDVIQNFAPCIYVQRLPTADLTIQLNLEAAKNSQPATLFEGDIIGSMLAQTFSNVFKTLTFTSDTQASLVNISKVSNVLYCQFLLTLHNVTVDSRRLDSYFINLEVLLY